MGIQKGPSRGAWMGPLCRRAPPRPVKVTKLPQGRGTGSLGMLLVGLVGRPGFASGKDFSFQIWTHSGHWRHWATQSTRTGRELLRRSRTFALHILCDGLQALPVSFLVSLLSSPDFWNVVAIGILQPCAYVFADRLAHGKRTPPEA
jgi:hypothetical protein